MSQNEHKYTNRLINEPSPYLLQHAHNPVNWYPWGENAFFTAHEENKPILVSIGYAACHWCHVMEYESFEDEETAKIMNDLFINIKVDREERPDVDQIYMKFVQMTTGSGGWPLNVFLTPEREPFFGGTYFPPDRRYGRESWKEVVQWASDFFHNHKDKINQNTEIIRKEFEKSIQTATGETVPDSRSMMIAGRNLTQLYDAQHGGLGSAPKFPAVQPLMFFLRMYKNTGKKDYLDMVENSLRKMAHGGIYDQIGGGFARYSVDNHWLVPHFEKMLYDNAQLAPLYLEAYLVTKDAFYLQVVRDTLGFVSRELLSPEGGFYSSLDADSEGIEGKFYTWDKSEIDDILEDFSDLFCDYYGVTDIGNFEGKNILHVATGLEQTAKRFNLTVDETELVLKECRKKLFHMRSTRIPPALDDKSLTAWNALMLSAYARAYQVLKTPEYKSIIENNIDFIFRNLVVKGELLRTYNKGTAQYFAYLDDFAYLIHALLDAYEALFNNEYIEKAAQLLDYANTNFWDDQNNGYFYTTGKDPYLIHRLKEEYDQSMPSAAAVMVLNNLRFFSLTEDKNLLDKAENVLKKYKDALESNPYGYSSYLLGLDFYLQKPKEIVIVSQDTDKAGTLTDPLFQHYLPNKVLLNIDEKEQPAFLTAAMLKGKKSIEGLPTAYVCHNFSCSAPVTKKEELIKLVNQ